MSSWDSDYRYEPSPLFEQIFRCLPFDSYKNPALETGNKIIMPQSSLSLLVTLPVRYPLFFKIQSFNSDKTSHCGVLEFGDDEGFVYMPRWMMENLDVHDGGEVILSDAALYSKGCYMKLRPHAAAFVELSNPKAVLETALRGFACLSCGDTIMVRYNERDYYLDVLEVRPGGEAVSLIDTDCMLDFAPPLDSVEPPRREMLRGDEGGDGEEREEEEEMEAVKEFRPFAGVARRLDGTAVMVKSAVAGRKREKDGGKSDEKIKKDGGERREVSEFRPFVGTARRLGGAVESGGCSAVVAEGKKREKDGGKLDEKIKKDGGERREVSEFRPFVGTARRLGATVESGGCSAAVEEGKKREKDDA